jgi:hypothetical protein
MVFRVTVMPLPLCVGRWAGRSDEEVGELLAVMNAVSEKRLVVEIALEVDVKRMFPSEPDPAMQLN